MKKFKLILAAAVLSGCNQGQQFALGSRADNFAQSVIYNNQLDVVFVVDNSSGMSIYNEKLQETLPTLVNALISKGMDLHVAVVTSSLGGTNPNGGAFIGNPVYMTNSTPNLAGVLNARLNAVGDDGSNLERGLDSLQRVLSPTYLNGPGKGFLRPDALLAVIALSTEDDKSSDLSGGVPAYVSFLDQLKGFYDDGGRRWFVNFIGVLSLQGSCATTPDQNYKEPGVRWINLADQTDGITQSICDADWSQGASNIHTRISQILTDYHLSKVPNESTLRVTVNGVEVARNATNGWDYIAAGNFIRFYGTAIPRVDSNIQVAFTPSTAN